MSTEQVEDREIVAIRTEEIGGHLHVTKVKLADDTEQGGSTRATWAAISRRLSRPPRTEKELDRG